jgi:hypothetical protein
MTATQLVALVVVLFGAMLLGSLPAVLGFMAGLGVGWLVWGRL